MIGRFGTSVHSTTAHEGRRRGGWGLAVKLYSFLNLDARCGWVINATPRTLYPWERPGTRCTGGWVSLRTGLDGCGKSPLHRASIPGPYSPYRAAIPTELSRSPFGTSV